MREHHSWAVVTDRTVDEARPIVIIAVPIEKGGAGGLATAMHPILRGSDGVWIGWSGDTSEATDETRKAVLEEWADKHRYFAVDLDKETAQGFYEGIANQALWQFTDLLTKSAGTRKQLAELKQRFGSRKILLGVDRLDYTKGIPERLRAYRKFLQDYPEWRGKVVLIQVAVPSRERVPRYTRLRREVEELIGEINGDWSTPNWSPITYLRRNLPQAELAALYARADVALVTPLRDGLNLVAKEYESRAKYYLSNPDEMVALLAELLEPRKTLHLQASEPQLPIISASSLPLR